MKWIDPTKRKPEGKIFWALTEGRPEVEGFDWVIRKLINDKYGDYRSLDYAEAYYLPNSLKTQSRWDTIFAWLPINEIKINNDNIFEAAKNEMV